MSNPEPSLKPSIPALDAALLWGRQLVTPLLAARWKVVGYMMTGGILAAGIALLLPNRYTSSATFIAQGSSSLNLPAALQGAALSLGLERGNDYSPKFYSDLLSSRPVLRSAVLTAYPVSPNDSAGHDYIHIEGFDDEPPARGLDRAIRHLAKHVSASADVRTNMITLSVEAPTPELSRAIAVRLLSALDSLNVGFRQSQSRGSREFYEARMDQTRRELDSAETAVRAFMQRNRVASSPALEFELKRLEREAELKQSLYATVVQQFEQARLQEARNVPTLTILAEPFLPVKKSAPNRRFIVVLGLLGGLVLLVAELRILEAFRRLRLLSGQRSQ
jgi:uncharacterized protein involved in exopolysaccharide biosynthesis